MAEVNIFHYRYSSGFLHSMDTGIKLILLLVYSAMFFKSGTAALIPVSITVIWLFLIYLSGKGSMIREMKSIFLIMLLIFSGTLYSSVQSGEGSVINHFLTASEACWRFLMIVLAGLILSATTMPEDIHRTVYKILNPLPLVPAGVVASRISLTIMFIPVLMDMVKEISEARRARYIEGSRNPLRKIISLAIPLTAGIIHKADETAMALESRLYRLEVKYETEGIRTRDIGILLAGLIPPAAGLLIQLIDQYS